MNCNNKTGAIYLYIPFILFVATALLLIFSPSFRDNAFFLAERVLFQLEQYVAQFKHEAHSFSLQNTGDVIAADTGADGEAMRGNTAAGGNADETLQVEDAFSSAVTELNNKGVEYLKNGNYERAIGLFEELSQTAPTDAVVRKNLAHAYHERARVVFGEGKRDVAVELLRKALELSVDSEVISRSLSAVLQEQGHAAMKKENYSIAAHYFEEALSLCAQEQSDTVRDYVTAALTKQGITFVENYEYDRARGIFTAVLEYDNSHFYAIFYLGEIAYMMQELNEAERLWKKAFSVATSEERSQSGIAQKLLTVASDKHKESALASYPAAHFIIKYNKEATLHGGYKIREILRRAYREVGQDFNFFPKTKITVIVDSDNEFAVDASLGENVHVKAVYDGKIRLPVMDDETNIAEFETLVFHEYTHALVFILSGGRSPLWLNEGLSQYQEASRKDLDTRMFQEALRKNRLYPLNTMLKAGVISEVDDPYLYYRQAYTMTEYLIDRFGFYKMRHALEGFKNGDSWDIVCDELYHLSIGGFEKRWRRYVEDKYLV